MMPFRHSGALGREPGVKLAETTGILSRWTRPGDFRPKKAMGSGMTFQLGEKVVYPNHGVGTVENISVRAFGLQMERFYLLKLQANSLTVMIPFSHVQHVGLRKVTKNVEVGRVLEFLSAGRCKRCADWKDRFKENSEKMQSGSLLDVAQVMKSLLIQQLDKPLSFREKKMLDRARHMLITEFSISRRLPTAAAGELLERALQKSDLHLPVPL